VNKGFYIQKGDNGMDQENILKKKQIKKISDLLEEGKTETAGMKTRQPAWNDLLRKEGKTNSL